MTEIKGYVRYFQETIPVTWERETDKFVYRVKRLSCINGKWMVNKRLFDDKMHKDEIVLKSSVFIQKLTDVTR